MEKNSVGKGNCITASVPFGYTECTMENFSVIVSALKPLLILVGIIFVFVSMRTRRFYFVRHGETLLNKKHVRQGVEGELSEKGRAQAATVGTYLKQFPPIKRIIASSYPRAKETAEIINLHLHVPIIYSELLVERRNPSEIIGKDRDDPDTKKIVDQIELSYHPDDYRFSDEENFSDLKKRARKCLHILAHQGARETIVITHHVFLKIFVAYLLYGERLHAGDFAKLSFFNFSDNAGITVCEYSPWKFFSPTRGWSVVSFNEKIS